jgi:nitrite reductase (NADH) large subunit
MKRISVEKPRKQKLVLIGNGMSSFKFCEKFLKYGVGRHYDLVVFGEESHPAYDRVNLTRYFTDPTAENLYLATTSWYSGKNIRLHTDEKVTEINRVEKWVKTSKGRVEKYDKLILATGSKPFIPPIKGIHLKGVFVYRSLDDLEAIRLYVKQSKKAVVIGGGILGLEAAKALHIEGLEVTVIEKNPYILNRQLDAAGANILKETIESKGLRILPDQSVSFISGIDNVESIHLLDATSLKTDMALIIAGIRPMDELAKLSGIEVAQAGGILVNAFGLTSDENIYAIGECVNSFGRNWGLALPCFEMAEVLAARLGGIFKAFSGEELFTQLKFPGVKMTCFGDVLCKNKEAKMITFTDKGSGIYKRINVSSDGKYLLGGILIGDTSDFSALLQMIRNKTVLETEPEKLIDGSLSKSTVSILDWPDETKICLCEGISKGTILSAIRQQKLVRVDEIKMYTGAGTGCESCTSVIEEILEAVNRDIISKE